jgi:hypothetical protein
MNERSFIVKYLCSTTFDFSSPFQEHVIPLVWGAQAASPSFSAALPKSSSGQSILRALL